MNEIDRAVEFLRTGKLVAFPTETVYGLGADATNASAVRKIFSAKGRPATNPLIAHVSDAHVAQRYASHWPDDAALLSRRFWPGPLTLVVPKSTAIVAEATAGRGTVGLRAPDHPLALEMLARFNAPVAAPSANRSTRVSPTRAEHVREELGDAVDLILDGGPSHVGIESTVLDLSTPTARILRPGAITREQIESVIGPVDLFTGTTGTDIAAASPGQHAVHYAPRAASYRFVLSQRRAVIDWCRDHQHVAWAVLFLGPLDTATALSAELENVVITQTPPSTHKLIQMPAGAVDYARRLYATLRELDDQAVEVIWIQMPPDRPEWLAVRDRLTRATRPADSALRLE